MINRAGDPRTDDRIAYELLRIRPESEEPEVIGTAVFRRGTRIVEADEEVATAVRELLDQGFVDRVQADERPRGYRRTGTAGVELLVPGMAEHFIARLRGLWLPYPDGSVVTAREAGPITLAPPPSYDIGESVEALPGVTDPSVRRATLASSDATTGGGPLVRAHDPLPGTRPTVQGGPVRRSDCGWIV
jgi:hypothetical protein